MDTMPFTNRQRIVKGCVVGMLGLAVLVGSSTVSLAASKLRLGQRSCFCNCSTSQNAGVGVLSWDLKGNEHCSIVGNVCHFNGVAGKITQCSSCTVILVDSTLKNSCSPAVGFQVAPGGGVIKPPAEQGDPVPSTSTTGTLGGVYQRGVEGAPATTAPTEKKDKAPAPK